MSEINACCCIGPQNGEPLCSCRMRGVVKRDGRYIIPEQDLGSVVEHKSPEFIEMDEIKKKFFNSINREQ